MSWSPSNFPLWPKDELTKAYTAVEDFYGQARAARSGLLKIRHIDEGLVILDCLGASAHTRAAWCLHPVLQHPFDWEVNAWVLRHFHFETTLFVRGYRDAANAWLSDKVGEGSPKLSPYHEVNQMLIADKVQNRKDFLLYHHGSHPRSDELARYFDKWLKALNVSSRDYHKYCWIINQVRAALG